MRAVRPNICCHVKTTRTGLIAYAARTASTPSHCGSSPTTNAPPTNGDETRTASGFMAKTLAIIAHIVRPPSPGPFNVGKMALISTYK